MLENIQEIISLIMPWLLSDGLKIIGILIGAYVAIKIAQIFVDRIVRKAVRRRKGMSKSSEERRENTLIQVFNNGLKVIIWTIAILMTLSQAGVDTKPLLGAAGILGLAFGFGGQYLIKDIITGFFIILENQYRTGDVVTISGLTGRVETINLRMTTLRDVEGTVHHVPNGTISTSSNLTKHFSKLNLKIGISYDADIDQAKKIVNEVGKELAQDPEWKEKIKSTPEFSRVDDLGDSAVIIKIDGEVEPLEKWGVNGELRKRIKIAFDKAGIEIPFPQIVTHQAKK